MSSSSVPALESSRPTRLHRQRALRARQRPDLALLINLEHYGMGPRIDVEADDIA